MRIAKANIRDRNASTFQRFRISLRLDDGNYSAKRLWNRMRTVTASQEIQEAPA